MKVLAERSNKIFIVGLIIMVVLGVLMALMMNDGHFRMYRYYSDTLTVFGVAFSVFITTLCAFIERMFMPKILIEYDNAGIYIYKYKLKEPIILRYENIWSFISEVDTSGESVTLEEYSYERAALVGKGLTGILKICTCDGEINVRGIKNVKEVERKLDKLHDEFMDLRNERYEAIIEQKRREEEFEELAKHDPNT